MAHKSKATIDTAALSKKYKCDVNRLIRLWKKGKTDFEISQSLGIDILKIMQVRQEITFLHERERQHRNKLVARQPTIFTHNPR